MDMARGIMPEEATCDQGDFIVAADRNIGIDFGMPANTTVRSRQ
jgi:hypothetical protein